jgi:hypothetical protein
MVSRTPSRGMKYAPRVNCQEFKPVFKGGPLDECPEQVSQGAER